MGVGVVAQAQSGWLFHRADSFLCGGHELCASHTVTGAPLCASRAGLSHPHAKCTRECRIPLPEMAGALMSCLLTAGHTTPRDATSRPVSPRQARPHCVTPHPAMAGLQCHPQSSSCVCNGLRELGSWSFSTAVICWFASGEHNTGGISFEKAT